MKAAAAPSQLGDPTRILDRHTTRRTRSIPTVSVLVGPIGAGARTWRRWAAGTGRCVVVAKGNHFPYAQWIGYVAEQIDLPVAAIHFLARRAGRDPNEFLAAWRVKTRADRERLWSDLPPEEDDDLLRVMAALAVEPVSPGTIVSTLTKLRERIVAMVVRLAPSAAWPSVLFVAGTAGELSFLTPEAASWALRVPSVPIAVAVPSMAWAEYLAAAPDSRAKALLCEGEITVPVLDAKTVEQTLTEAGAGPSAAAVLTANGADGALVESAVALIRATAVAPDSKTEDNRARSAAEQFLFEFLESIPQTAARFELNATLTFRFGPYLAEVDLLCREPPIALEIDGYFHFRDAAHYRRDRAKDWELQRRGYLVLRFLAEDVIPQLEAIRDRVLDAMARTPPGGPP
jgi:very-short-patch-repair endonuclease